MSSSSKAPTPPDANKTSQAQWGYNQQAANFTSGLNAPNLYTPFGSVTYDKNSQGGVTGQNVSLNPADQQALDQQRGLTMGLGSAALNQLQNLPQGQFSLSDLGVNMPGAGDFQDWGNKIAQTSYNQAADLIRPDIEQGRGRLEQRIASQGLDPAAEAAGTLTGNYERGVGNQLNSLANQAVQQSGNEMSRLYGLQSDQYNQALQSKLLERQQPFNELAQYIGTAPQQPYQSAQSITPVNTQAPDFQGAQALNYQGQLANYQAQQQQQNQLWSTLGSLGGAALGSFAGPAGMAAGSKIGGSIGSGSFGKGGF